jgi:hypothetical protein
VKKPLLTSPCQGRNKTYNRSLAPFPDKGRAGEGFLLGSLGIPVVRMFLINAIPNKLFTNQIVDAHGSSLNLVELLDFHVIPREFPKSLLLVIIGD